MQEQNENTFVAIAREWFYSQQPQWKESSCVKYQNILRSYLMPNFAERTISDITREEILSLRGKLLVNGGLNENGLSPKTVAGILSVMKNILRYAAKNKGCAVADIGEIFVRQSQKPMRILSPVEQKKLSEYLCSHLNSCNLGILICLYTGLRVGEICALQWQDISLDEQYLYIHQTMQRLQSTQQGETKTHIIISAPKSDCSIRKVPIPDAVLCLLQQYQENGAAFVLTGKSDRYMEPRTMQNRFKAVVSNCAICDANFHALRHTFATRCVELGFDLKSLSEILGHASINITLNRYVHPSMELKQKNMNLLSGLLTLE